MRPIEMAWLCLETLKDAKDDGVEVFLPFPLTEQGWPKGRTRGTSNDRFFAYPAAKVLVRLVHFGVVGPEGAVNPQAGQNSYLIPGLSNYKVTLSNERLWEFLRAWHGYTKLSRTKLEKLPESIGPATENAAPIQA